MLWVWLACAVLAGIGGGIFLGLSAAGRLLQPGLTEQRINIARDHNLFLSVIRRELANWMLQRDPDRYRKAYKEAHEVTATIAAADEAEKRRQLARLAERYPFFADFDLVNTREYVLYSDALATNTYEEIQRYYTDIICFQVLQAAIDVNWPAIGATSENELEGLDSYVQRFKDTLFRRRMESALSEYRAFQRGKGDSAGPGVYETTLLTVRQVAHFAELRYGIHFKATDEFGLYGVFFTDNSDSITSFYRSNAGFTEETFLDEMRIDDPL